MNRDHSLRRIRPSALPETCNSQHSADHELNSTQPEADSQTISVVEQVGYAQSGTEYGEEHAEEHDSSAIASVHTAHLTHTHTSRHRDVYPLPDHPAWLAFMDGYLAGITHGIGLGRAQVDQEHADATTFPNDPARTASYEATRWAADGLSRAEWIAHRRAERTAARAEYDGPNLSAEQIRQNAFRSWGLTPHHRQDAA
jgi:hypothetical protein